MDEFTSTSALQLAANIGAKAMQQVVANIEKDFVNAQASITVMTDPPPPPPDLMAGLTPPEDSPDYDF